MKKIYNQPQIRVDIISWERSLMDMNLPISGEKEGDWTADTKERNDNSWEPFGEKDNQ